MPWSPWWRLGAASLAVGALAWGAGATDAALWLGDDVRSDLAASSADPQEGAFVRSAALACPGTAPWPGDDDPARPRYEVLAAGAPASVLDAVPPPADDTSATAGPDDEASTAGPDDPAATAGPDGAASTAGPDGVASTAGPDDAASTAGPEDAATTAGPDDAASTAGPDDEGPTTPAPPPGASVIRTSDPDGPVAELDAGRPVGVSLDREASALMEAQDELAPGAAGGQLGLGTEAGSRGLTLAACAPVGETQWLVGGGAAPGRTEQLVLSNPGPDPVTVSVAVWGSEGPVPTTGASGIVVPGGGRTVALLDGLAPGADAPVLAVSSNGGPVVAHLAETYREGTTDRGTEIVGPSAAPATDLVVPALPGVPEGDTGEVVLRLAAPGDVQAVVDLTALTPDGAVRLAGQVTRVPAGSTVDVPLPDLPEGATALRLRSDEPVTGGARLEILPAERDPEILDPASATAAPGDGSEGTQGDGDVDDALATAGPGDDASATSSPDETDDPDPQDEPDGRTEQGEPLRRPAGDLAWVGATVPSTSPSGMALPDRSQVPGARATLALTAVDGTTAWITWVDEEGEETSRSVPLTYDTTVLLPVPEDARAVWVVGAGPAGVVAAVHVEGRDGRGAYVASTTVPTLPWTQSLTQVRPVVP